MRSDATGDVVFWYSEQFLVDFRTKLITIFPSICMAVAFQET